MLGEALAGSRLLDWVPSPLNVAWNRAAQLRAEAEAVALQRGWLAELPELKDLDLRCGWRLQ